MQESLGRFCLGIWRWGINWNTAGKHGCKNVEQVELNARAADLELVSDEHPQAVFK